MFVNELMNECVVFVNVGPEGTVGRMNERTQWVSRIFIREFMNLGGNSKHWRKTFAS